MKLRFSPLKRSRDVWRVIAAMCAMALAAVFAAAPSQASTTRVTEGDAQAVFEAFEGAGWAIINHQPLSSGAPTDIELQASIRPFAGSPWDGRHFCADDWHVILMADIEGGDQHFTVQDAEALMDPLSIVFHLDGSLLPTERTAIKRMLNPGRFGLQSAFDFQQGALMAPSALSVGQHTVTVAETFQGEPVFGSTIQIFIDPSGTGACL